MPACTVRSFSSERNELGYLHRINVRGPKLHCFEVGPRLLICRGLLALLVIGFSAPTSNGRESFQVCELSKEVLSIISFALENGRVPAAPHAVPISPHIHEAVGFRR
jgi:hypothetical protein